MRSMRIGSDGRFAQAATGRTAAAVVTRSTVTLRKRAGNAGDNEDFTMRVREMRLRGRRETAIRWQLGVSR